jgi:hypothetical protein
VTGYQDTVFQIYVSHVQGAQFPASDAEVLPLPEPLPEVLPLPEPEPLVDPVPDPLPEPAQAAGAIAFLAFSCTWVTNASRRQLLGAPPSIFDQTLKACLCQAPPMEAGRACDTKENPCHESARRRQTRTNRHHQSESEHKGIVHQFL